MKRLSVAIGLIGLLVAVAEAAVRDFEEVPASANKYLKAVKGKPIRTGKISRSLDKWAEDGASQQFIILGEALMNALSTQP